MTATNAAGRLARPSVWPEIREEARRVASGDVAMAGLLAAAILDFDSLRGALSYHLARKLGGQGLSPVSLRAVIEEAYEADPSIVEAAEDDLHAILERDPTCRGYVKPFLFFKGFLALQTHRVAHALHGAGRQTQAGWLQGRASELFHVDIHPAARFGRGVFIDHGTGIAIGGTAVVGDGVSMLQGVTLGGDGAAWGPEIGAGVLLSADAVVAGGVRVGDDAKIAAGSLVRQDVPARCTAVGVPARLVNCRPCGAARR